MDVCVCASCVLEKRHSVTADRTPVVAVCPTGGLITTRDTSQHKCRQRHLKFVVSVSYFRLEKSKNMLKKKKNTRQRNRPAADCCWWTPWTFCIEHSSQKEEPRGNGRAMAPPIFHSGEPRGAEWTCLSAFGAPVAFASAISQVSAAAASSWKSSWWRSGSHHSNSLSPWLPFWTASSHVLYPLRPLPLSQDGILESCPSCAYTCLQDLHRGRSQIGELLASAEENDFAWPMWLLPPYAGAPSGPSAGLTELRDTMDRSTQLPVTVEPLDAQQNTTEPSSTAAKTQSHHCQKHCMALQRTPPSWRQGQLTSESAAKRPSPAAPLTMGSASESLPQCWTTMMTGCWWSPNST